MKSKKPNKAKLAEIFRHLGKTQQDAADTLAAESGRSVSQQVIQNWIRRERVPTAWVQYIVRAAGDKVTAHEIRPDVFPETP